MSFPSLCISGLSAKPWRAIQNLAAFSLSLWFAGCSLPFGASDPASTTTATSSKTATRSSSVHPLPESGRLSLDDCLRFGLEKNFRLRAAEQNLRAARAGVETARSEFDPQLFASSRRETLNGRSWSEFNSSAGVNARLPTGTEVEFEGGQVPTRTGDFRNDFGSSTSDYAITVRQQLLRGADPRANLAGIRIAQLIRDQAQATRAAEVLEMLRAVESGYHAAAVAAQVEQSYAASVQRGESVFSDVKARRDAGAATNLDSLEAEVALSAARERALAASKNYVDRVDELWLAIGAPQRGQYPQFRFATLSDEAIPGGVPDADEVIARALHDTPTAVLLVNEVQRREVELRRARNQALPRLEVELSAAPSSSLSSSGSKSGDWEGVAIGRIVIPWTFRAERAQLETAKAALGRSQVAREEAEQRLRQRIAELCRAIRFGRLQLSAANQSRKVSLQKWQEQLQRQREGLVTARDLREAEEDLRNSEVRALEARLGLLTAWSNLGQLDGSIAQRHNLLF